VVKLPARVNRFRPAVPPVALVLTMKKPWPVMATSVADSEDSRSPCRSMSWVGWESTPPDEYLIAVVCAVTRVENRFTVAL
jgi:hypothetical protein